MSRPDLSRVRTLLWDLDGTLLQVSMERFIPAYLEGVAGHLGLQGEPEVRSFARMVRGVIHAMLARTGSNSTNEEFFLQRIEALTGIDPRCMRRALTDFCRDGLHGLRPLVEPWPEVGELLDIVRQRNFEMVLATNPVFPLDIIRARLAWGGLAEEDFALVTCFENTRYCKPQPEFFVDLLNELGRQPDECLMIGNDTEHDLAASGCGIPTYLVETWMIDRCAGNFRADFRGGHSDLLNFLAGVGVDSVE